MIAILIYLTLMDGFLKRVIKLSGRREIIFVQRFRASGILMSILGVTRYQSDYAHSAMNFFFSQQGCVSLQKSLTAILAAKIKSRLNLKAAFKNGSFAQVVSGWPVPDAAEHSSRTCPSS
jgi:hypothetical protein